MKKLQALSLCLAMIFIFSSCVQTSQGGGRQLANNRNNTSSTVSVESDDTPSRIVSYAPTPSYSTVAPIVSTITGNDDSQQPTSSTPASSLVASSEPVSSAASSQVTSSNPIPETNEYKELTVSAPDLYNLGYMKMDGRFTQMKTKFGKPKDSLIFDNAAQLMAMNLDCEGDVTMDYEITVKVSTAQDAFLDLYLRVIIDGVDMGRIVLTGTRGSADTGSVTIAKDLPKGKHEIKIYKSTESQLSILNIINFTFNGVPVERPKDSDLYIEFMGDSYTAGYGNLGDQNSPTPNAGVYSDATVTFAFQTAENLGADISTISSSGNSFAFPFMGISASDYFKRISPCYRNDAGEHDFENARQPDIMVVALGANDQNNVDNMNLTVDDFRNNSADLMATIKECYPNTKIVWYYDQNKESPYSDAVKESVEAAGGYFLIASKLAFSGGGWHPNVEENTNMANELTEFIQNNVL